MGKSQISPDSLSDGIRYAGGGGKAIEKMRTDYPDRAVDEHFKL